MDGLIALPMGVVPPERPYMGARSKHSADTRAPVKYIDSHVITCVPYEQKQPESLPLSLSLAVRENGHEWWVPRSHDTSQLTLNGMV